MRAPGGAHPGIHVAPASGGLSVRGVLLVSHANAHGLPRRREQNLAASNARGETVPAPPTPIMRGAASLVVPLVPLSLGDSFRDDSGAPNAHDDPRHASIQGEPSVLSDASAQAIHQSDGRVVGRGWTECRAVSRADDSSPRHALLGALAGAHSCLSRHGQAMGGALTTHPVWSGEQRAHETARALGASRLQNREV